jgi:hypothetical protein
MEMRKAIPMKTSISTRVIVVAILGVALSGALAMAQNNAGKAHARPAPRGDSDAHADSGGSAGPSAPHAAPFYKATPPRYGGTSALPHPAGRPYPGAHTFPNKPVLQHRPTASVTERKETPEDVQSEQPTATDAQKGGERTGNWSHNNRSGKSGLDPQSVARLREWRGKGDNVATAAAKHHDHRHHHHGHDWWRHHCGVIILVGWGYWGWDSGWWYPAWGYDPIYSSYAFDEPIYGYGVLPPDQVIANVQGALQDLGYYSDEIDGELGPATRAALEDYQRDNGLPVTGLIDRETLESLGFIE